MKAFIQFVVKEIYHISRDYRTLLVLFGMPIIQIIVFGFAIRTEINDAEIGIIDRSKDDVTKKLTDKILSSGYFIAKKYDVAPDSIENAFQTGAVKAVVIFGQNFGANLKREGEADVQLILDATNPNVATLVSSYAKSIFSEFQIELADAAGYKPFLGLETKMMYNPAQKSVYMFVPGLIAMILMLVCALMTSIAITREKELGAMETLLVSPLKPLTIIVGKVLPYLFLSFLNVLTILYIAVTVFETPFKGDLGFFFSEAILFILTALSLGILISTIAKTQQVAMMASMAGLLMPTMLLSGFIFPIENMPEFLQYISLIIPARWFLVIVKGIMLKGVGIEYLWKETLILAGMTALFLGLSLKNFKIRL